MTTPTVYRKCQKVNYQGRCPLPNRSSFWPDHETLGVPALKNNLFIYLRAILYHDEIYGFSAKRGYK